MKIGVGALKDTATGTKENKDKLQIKTAVKDKGFCLLSHLYYVFMQFPEGLPCHLITTVMESCLFQTVSTVSIWGLFYCIISPN